MRDVNKTFWREINDSVGWNDGGPLRRSERWLRSKVIGHVPIPLTSSLYTPLNRFSMLCVLCLIARLICHALPLSLVCWNITGPRKTFTSQSSYLIFSLREFLRCLQSSWIFNKRNYYTFQTEKLYFQCIKKDERIHIKHILNRTLFIEFLT